MNRLKVLLISTGQPATNPRLVKEACALEEAGFEVLIVYCQWVPWANEIDKTILMKHQWQVHCVENNEKIFEKILYKMVYFIGKYFTLSHEIAEMYMARHYKKMQKIVSNISADIYVAHNLGALAIAFQSAQLHASKVGFDAEDFHRGENDNAHSLHHRACKYLENKYLPRVNYITAASPLIAEAYQKLFNNLRPTTILNVFEKAAQDHIALPNADTLKLFWFSQTIGKGRGLEEIIEAIGKVNFPIMLTLLGNVSEEYKKHLCHLVEINRWTSHKIEILRPVHPDDIVKIAAKHHVGLALERPTPTNRNLCLTNKIFTYLSASCAIIATRTKAQAQFLSNYPNIGFSYEPGDIEALTSILEQFAPHSNILNDCRKNSGELATKLLNWDVEKNKYLKVIQDTISQES